jgi:hypothetical protein
MRRKRRGDVKTNQCTRGVERWKEHEGGMALRTKEQCEEFEQFSESLRKEAQASVIIGVHDVATPSQALCRTRA